MPIYEFYCRDCHTIFNFFSKTINTRTVPACPKCENPRLTRQVSLFAVTGRAEEAGDADPGLDASKMEKAMEWMARQSGDISEDDPRQAARLMRQFSDMTGVELGPGMQEALHRMAAGEDPEQVEAEMGDALEAEEPFLMPGKNGLKGLKKRLPPEKDETLYDL